MTYGDTMFWRETMKPARFLIFDGRAVLVLMPAIMHLRPWTLMLAILTMFVFWWFERKGVPAQAILRWLRARLIGQRRSARGVFEERTAVDFGFECAEVLRRQSRAKPAKASAKTSETDHG